MIVQILAPGVKHAKEAGIDAEALGIGGDGEQGLRGGAEENVVEHLLVLKDKVGDGCRQSEDQVEVVGGQQLGLSLFEPLEASFSLALGAVPVATGAIARMSMPAVVTKIDDTAQLGRAAELDGPH